MNGALHANGSAVSTPVGRTTYNVPCPHHNLYLTWRERRAIVDAEEPFLPDFVQRLLGKCQDSDVATR